MGRWQSETLPASVAPSPTADDGLNDDAGVSRNQHEIRPRIAPDMACRCRGQSIADRIDDDIMAHRQGERATDDPDTMRMSGRDGVIAIAGRKIMAMARAVIMDKSRVAAPPAGTTAIDDDGTAMRNPGAGRDGRMPDDLRLCGRTGHDGHDEQEQGGAACKGGADAETLLRKRLGIENRGMIGLLGWEA